MTGKIERGSRRVKDLVGQVAPADRPPPAQRASVDASETETKSGNSTSRSKHNDTVQCLLNLRSVRDQFRDAELDLHSEYKEVAEKLEKLEDHLLNHLTDGRSLRDGVGLLTVAVVGDFNSGKSTFINALLGTKLCPVGDEPTTASVTYFIHGDKQRFELERDGTRKTIRKQKYLSMVGHGKVKDEDREAHVFHVSTDSPVLEHIRLVDTPGFNAPPPNKNDTEVTMDAVLSADALFVIADARKGNPTKTLLEQLDRLRDTRQTEFGPPSLFLLLNKADRLPPSIRKEVEDVSRNQYDETFRNVTLVSALQLNDNDTDDAALLDSLEITTRQIRDALSHQATFEASISAMVVTDRGQKSYLTDINGNVYETKVSSNGDLASREQLAEMVRSVTSERHARLVSQYQRRTSQLRKDWQWVVSALVRLCKCTARASYGDGGAMEKLENGALKAIDDAKTDILNQVGGIFDDVVGALDDDAGADLSNYDVEPSLDKIYDVMYDVVENHENWDQVRRIVKNLIGQLKRVYVFETTPDVDDLKGRMLSIVRESLESNQKKLTESEDEEDELLRSILRSILQWTTSFQDYLQKDIDRLQKVIIRMRRDMENKVTVSKNDLTKLRERIEELKEYTP